jgi:sugar lactone lactonase YvrE
MRPSARRRRRLAGAVFLLILLVAALGAGAIADPATAVRNNEQYGFLNQIGSSGTGVGQFGNGASPGPYGVAVDPAGNVFAVDPNNGAYRVLKFAPNGAHITSFGLSGSSAGELGSAYGIGVDSSGVVYVIDTWRSNANRIQYFSSPDGGATYTSAGQVTVAGAAGVSFQIAVDGQGCAYVTDSASGRIVKYRVAANALVTSFGNTGAGAALLADPKGIAVSSDGLDVYVVDNVALKRYHSADAGVTYSYAETVPVASGTFGNPWGLALDGAGNLLVTDINLDQVIKVTPAGAVVTSWGSTGAGDYGLRGPRAVAVGANGCVYVADTGLPAPAEHPEYSSENHRVMRYARDLTPPVSSVTGAPTGWTNAAEVELRFSGTDPVVADRFTSGYQLTELFLDGGWSAYSGSYVVRDEGVTPVRYRAADERNNLEADQELQVRIDRTKPTIADSAVPSGWSKTPVPLAFRGDDALSGVARTEYSTDGGVTWTAAASVTVPASGATTLTYRSVDNAGNTSDARTATVLADSVKPAPKALADVTVKHRKTARFRYRVTDRACPQAKVVIKIRRNGRAIVKLPLGAQATGQDLTKSWKCTLARGKYTWTVYATDLAGNAQAKLVTRKLIVR